MIQEPTATASAVGNGEPRVDLWVGTTRVTLLGTAHVSRASADQVRRLLETEAFDAVAVELCPSRYQALLDPEALARMDLFAVIRQGRVAMVVASLALGAYQQRLADQFGIEPGAEQRMAISLARERHLPVLLVDREIGVTLKRVAANLGWWRRLELFSGLLASLLSREEVPEAEIERLKEGDVLETSFAEFTRDRQDLFLPLIDERDRYMAARLREEIAREGHGHVLAVLGAGHLKGVARYLTPGAGLTEREPPPVTGAAPGHPPGQTGGTDDARRIIAELERLPPPSPWPKVISWLILALILGGFAYGFGQSPQLGWGVVLDWILITGGLCALGTLLAAGHPLTVLSGFAAAPLTTLHPAIGAGMVTALVELWWRKPSVGDFGQLRRDASQVRSWWRNRVLRILLVFLFSNLGAAAGTYVAGFRIYDQLFS
jgi:pheromone shutdown protein TraB